MQVFQIPKSDQKTFDELPRKSIQHFHDPGCKVDSVHHQTEKGPKALRLLKNNLSFKKKLNFMWEDL